MPETTKFSQAFSEGRHTMKSLFNLVRHCRKYWSKRLPHDPSERALSGPPPGVDEQLLAQICQKLTGFPATGYHHLLLSGWKKCGAYRVFLHNAGNKKTSIIFKNAYYDQEKIPALTGLPVQPGAPEFTIYQTPSPELQNFLPRLYLCRQLEAGRHYHYLLEDLSQNYTRCHQPAHILEAVRQLPQLHRVLDQWHQQLPAANLLDYQHGFSQALQHYALPRLQRYRQRHDSRSAAQLLRQWDGIIALLKSPCLKKSASTGVIHGDYNSANLMTGQHAQLKVLDWEWSGVGFRHADLAALLKRTTATFEEQALQVYASLEPSLSFNEHLRQYHRCQLERGILDASFLAVQAEQTGHSTRLNLLTYIEDSIARSLRSLARLQETNVLRTLINPWS
jgi:hypothetical protein